MINTMGVGVSVVLSCAIQRFCFYFFLLLLFYYYFCLSYYIYFWIWLCFDDSTNKNIYLCEPKPQIKICLLVINVIYIYIELYISSQRRTFRSLSTCLPKRTINETWLHFFVYRDRRIVLYCGIWVQVSLINKVWK